MADEAEQALGKIHPAFETDLQRLGHNATIAVMEARYTHVRVRTADGAVIIQSRTGKGSLPVDRYAGTSGHEALTNSGKGRPATAVPVDRRQGG